ncbi:MAG: hypothetical protein ACW99L_17080, partial [Promethearchaeota archaeon]
KIQIIDHEVVLFIEDKIKRGKRKDKHTDYYCTNLKECIKRNSFVNETRKKLMRKKYRNYYKLKEETELL